MRVKGDTKGNYQDKIYAGFIRKKAGWESGRISQREGKWSLKWAKEVLVPWSSQYKYYMHCHRRLVLRAPIYHRLSLRMSARSQAEGKSVPD